MKLCLGAMRLRLAALLLVSTVMGADPAAAIINIGVSIAPQTSSPGSISPSPNGNTVTYEYTIFDGESLTDNIDVKFCVDTVEDSGWTSFDMHFGPNGGGGNLPNVTLPENVTFDANSLGTCELATIQIATGALNLADPQVDEFFNLNIVIGVENEDPGTGSNKPKVTTNGPTVIHVKVLVKSAAGTNIACFITDSGGEFLTSCEGVPVNDSGSDEGRFVIVANKKNVEVATNPGQFYYNLLYHNPGATDITVDVSFVRSGVSPKGAQAIHALVFPPPFGGISQAGFDAVNEGIPEGTDDLVEGITIPAGWTLWVDYHLDWNGLGAAVPPNCATTCAAANQPFSVTGTVTVTSGSSQQTEVCTAGAWGYKK